MFPLFLALSLAATAPTAVRADPSGEATLNAVAFAPLPANTAIEVRVLDDSEENLAIKRAVALALAERGFHTMPKEAPLVLTIETGDLVGAWQTPSPTERIPVPDDRGRLFPQGEVDVTRQVRLPLPRTTVVTPPQYRLGLTLDARTSGERIWQGWSMADLSQGQPLDLGRAMVPKLADSIGHTVREQVFPLE
jgi:hypothetical protein